MKNWRKATLKAAASDKVRKVETKEERVEVGDFTFAEGLKDGMGRDDGWDDDWDGEWWEGEG